MKHFALRFTAILVFLLLALLPGAATFAQNNSTADCNWLYTDNYLVPLGTVSADECAQMLFEAVNQFGLEETYGTWGGTGLYIDSQGNVYTASLNTRGSLDWTPAGTLNASSTGSQSSTGDTGTAQTHQPLTLDEIFTLVEDDINDFWSLQFKDSGANYVKPELVLYDRSRIRTGCGVVSAGEGPLYCPADHTAYFPRNFMENEMAAVGDFSVVVIIAHEWGHAVQNLANLNPGSATIVNELQADCFAGAYSSYATLQSVKVLVEDGDIEEGATALFLFGDPAGTPWFDPQAHGSGDQRYQAFVKGLQNDYTACMK